MTIEKTPTAKEKLNLPTVHERIYQNLKERILFGGFLPGKAVTLRGLAEDLDVSAMPVREAVRRLIAEKALEMHGNRRVSVPLMTQESYEELSLSRRLLEPELAVRAMKNLEKRDIEELARIDGLIDNALLNGDVEGYMRGNHQFHFFIYSAAKSPIMLGLVESLWLQFGPFMRLVYGRYGTANLEDQHRQAIDALRARDEQALRAAILADIGQGMHFMSDAVHTR
ncbi:GntR family transcriptional regulator [Rhodobacteraceae bacterium RKSG542]|uniref:GntR family transcriptional regulator n=1 Tax=Pseudovibrio flavus TaxID=2529854 RepID=UPI0012BC476C|nr:GntR family transcriptional regulator [Pseudovibrio flavus]MTI18070.1 GntR family transcriptional regulator [Pseudovibrio flavus]